MDNARIVRNKTTGELGFLKYKLDEKLSSVLFLNGKLLTVQSDDVERVDLNSVANSIFSNSAFDFDDLFSKSGSCEDCRQFILSLKSIHENGGKL